jgi:Tol biopolymer transport system component
MVKRKYFIYLILFIFAVFVPQKNANSQLLEPYPNLKWYTIETDHFVINFHEGSERTAKTIAKILEEVYGPVTDLYDHKPSDKTVLKITDVSDIANGAADYFGNRMFIFASPLDYDLRGTHNWLRNVITHEFTHIIQLQSAMKWSSTFPAIYLQWLDYENERRPDVLYGYPNVLISYPVAGIGVPAWFAEGVAQYQRQPLEYDYWDSHRDMILRMRSLGNNTLTWEEIGQFATVTSYEAESIYNIGYALSRYIAEKYGEDKLMKISRSLGNLTNFSMDAAMKDVLGKDGKELYKEYLAYSKNDYENRVTNVKANELKGKLIETEGFANYYPVFSPDGKKIAYLSNQDYDYGTTGLMIYDIATGKSEGITSPVGSSISWSPDSKKILFSRRNPLDLEYITLFDLHEYDLTKKEEKQLTKSRRAYYPSYSKDGSKIVYVVQDDGTLNIEIADSKGNNPIPLTFFDDGEQIYNPKFSPDGKKIYFDFAYENNRDIAVVDIETKEMEYLFEEPDAKIDRRTPVFSPDGTKLYFAADGTGIFNIYSYDMSTKEVMQLTNVLGGAFMPSVDGNGNLTYSSFEPTGYKIALLNNFTEQDPSALGEYNKPSRLIEKYLITDSTSAVGNKFDWNKLKNFNDKELPEYEVKPYTSQFTPLQFYPVIRYDNYIEDRDFLDAMKIGMYFFSDEVLGKFSVFGGALINAELERDLFLQFEYNNGMPIFGDFFRSINFYPKFTLEGYNVTRKTTADLIASIDTIPVGVEYDLLEFDFSMGFSAISLEHRFKFHYMYSKYASNIDAFAIPQSGISVRASSEDYFKASNFGFQYNFDAILPSKHEDINPIGSRLRLRYDYEISEINPEVEVSDDGNLITLFKNNKLNKLEMETWTGVGLFNDKHTINLSLRGAMIFGPEVDDFYNYYATGLPGMRGYPFYALGGGRLATAKLEYRMPLVEKLDFRIAPIYFDKLYLSVFGDFGNAWNGDGKLNDFKKDVGAELRLQTTSFYIFPTSIFFSAAYGLDEFTRRFQNTDVTYGKEWLFYFGVLFGFDFWTD